jgi:hypothetical protein
MPKRIESLGMVLRGYSCMLHVAKASLTTLQALSLKVIAQGTVAVG